MDRTEVDVGKVSDEVLALEDDLEDSDDNSSSKANEGSVVWSHYGLQVEAYRRRMRIWM